MHISSLSAAISFCLSAFFFSSSRRHTRCLSDWSSDVCSSDLGARGRRRTSPRPTVVVALASALAMLSMRRRRPWDVAMFAVSPALFVTATVNWDLLAVGFAVFGLYAWAKRHPLLAGILLGLGTAAKLWPGFIFIPLLLLGIRTRRFLEALVAFATGIVTWTVVNVPVLFGYPDAWWTFFKFNNTRAIDWGTFWYLGEHFPFLGALPGVSWFDGHIEVVNLLSYALFGLCCVGVGVLAFVAPKPPRVAQLAFLVLAGFLVF